MPKYTQHARGAVGRRSVYSTRAVRIARAVRGQRDKYGGFRSDYLYPALQRGGRVLSPVWESAKGAYRRISPKIYAVTAPIAHGIRSAGSLSPIIYNAAWLADYTSPKMDAAYGYTQDAASALAAYDALAGPRVTGSLANAGIHGVQTLYHGHRALTHLYNADPLNAALHSVYALSYGQRAAREGFAHLRNKYWYPTASAGARAQARPSRYRGRSATASYRYTAAGTKRRR